MDLENNSMTAHDRPDQDEKDIQTDNCANLQCKDICVEEIQHEIPDSSPPSPDVTNPEQREQRPVTVADTGTPPQAGQPDEASHSPAPQHQEPPDGAGWDVGEEPQCGDEKDDKASSIPEVVITQADEGRQAAASQPGGQKDTRWVAGAASMDRSSSQSDDPTCSDLQSLKSDSISLASEAAISGKSDGEQECQEDDVRSVTASSVTSLFQRLQLDPLEREWLRLAALGNTTALRQLLRQDPTLASKKTALHWAAKQGRLEMAEMMARAGVDVNVKSGYTALHLAALHGHPHIIQLLLNTYNAKANIRDYHGKMAMHYWSGSVDVFSRPSSQSCGKWSRGRRGQRYAHLPSLLLSSRSRSHGHLNLELATAPEQPPTSHARARSPS